MAKMVKKKERISFAGIPRTVMDSPDYKGLSGNAAKLLYELCYQYRGHNNGDLQAAWSLMSKRGFRSKATLSRAVAELISANFIIRTREGVFTNPGGRCALFALTWLPVNECNGKHDYPVSSVPPRKFSLERKTA